MLKYASLAQQWIMHVNKSIAIGVHCLILAVILGISTITLGISPIIWQDEVQIMDYGRTSMPHADFRWGINWLLDGRPNFSVNFLGPLVQETAFRELGGFLGTRLAALLGAVVASTALFGWLLRRGAKPALALLGSTLFLINPLIAQSYRGARVDALAMAFVFLSLWAINYGRCNRRDSKSFALYGLAGILLGIAGLIWPSIVILLPIVFYELASVNGISFKADYKAWLNFTYGSFCIILIAIVATFGLLLFCFPDTIVRDILALLNYIIRNQNQVAQRNGVDISNLVFYLAESFAYEPFLPVVSLLLLVIFRWWGLLLALLCGVVVVVATNPYIHRAIYLVPYLILTCVIGLDALLMRGIIQRHKVISKFAVTSIILWSMMITLGARTVTALRERNERDPNLIMSVAKTTIGNGPYNVYIEPWVFYYAGRELGWHMFRSFYGKFDGSGVVHADWSKLALHMDYLVFSSTDINADMQDLFRTNGFIATTVNPKMFSSSASAGNLRSNIGYVRDFTIFSRSPLPNCCGK